MTKALVSLWNKRIEKDKKAHESWRKEAKRIQAIYDADSSETTTKQQFNMLWSNTQIQHGALYSNTAKPDIRKRYTDSNELAKEVGTILERGIQYCQDVTDFDANIDAAVDDCLVAGMGLPRMRYEAKTSVQQDEFGNEFEAITQQLVDVEHISWSDFGFHPVTRWKDVMWCFIKHKKSRKDVEKLYGVTLSEGKEKELPDMVELYECFDKKRREIVIIAEGEDKSLKVQKDSLGLKGFYPFPKPLFFYRESKHFCPKPEYTYYEAQANNLDKIAGRIKAITTSIKEVGVYDSTLSQELGTIAKKPDGTFVPIENLTQKLQGADFNNVIATLPLEEKQRVLAELRAQLEAEKGEIYELTGISDIVRGATSASESATAQSMKGHYADMRFSRKRNAVNFMIRGVFRIMAEVIAEHFTPEILTKMTGIQVTPEMEAIMKDEVTRNFVIDVESDSTISADEQSERQSKLEFLSSVVDYVNNVLPAVQNQIMPMSLAKEILLMVISGWKHGRALEDLINSLGDENTPEAQLMQLQQQLQQMQQEVVTTQEQAQATAQQAEQVQVEAQSQVESAQGNIQAIQSEAQKQIETLQNELTKTQQQNEELRIKALGAEQLEKGASAKLKEAQAKKADIEAEQVRQEFDITNETQTRIDELQGGLAQVYDLLQTKRTKQVQVLRDDNGRMIGAEIIEA